MDSPNCMRNFSPGAERYVSGGCSYRCALGCAPGAGASGVSYDAAMDEAWTRGWCAPRVRTPRVLLRDEPNDDGDGD